MRFRHRLIFLVLLLQLWWSPVVYAQRASISLGVAKDYQRRALAQKDSSHYSEAERIYRQALQDSRLVDSHKVSLVLNYVDLCFLRGDITTALSLLDQHHPVTGQQEQRWTIRQAIAYSFVPDYAKADSLFDVASHIEGLDDDARYELLSYQGSMWMDRNNHHRALQFLNAAQSLPIVTNTQWWLLSLEKVLPMAYVHGVDEALSLVDSCIVWIQQNLGKAHHSYMVALRKRSELLMMQDRRTEASLAYQQFFELEKDFAKRNFVSMGEQRRLDFWKSHKPHLTEIFALEDSSAEFLLDVSLFRREVALLGSADSAMILQRLDVSGQRLRDRLGHGEVAIDFVCYTQKDNRGREIAKYGALIVPSARSGGRVTFVTLGKAIELENYKLKGNRSLINAIRSNTAADKNLVYSDKALFNRIWQPLEPFLRDARDVFFVPDGIINLLGIENLAGSEQLPPLHRLSSLARLHEQRQDAESHRRAYLIGGLDYDSVDSTQHSNPNHETYDYLMHYFPRRNRMFQYLKNARAEVLAIDSLMGDGDLSHAESEEMFKQRLATSHYDIIHLSTHGYAMQVNVGHVPHALSDSLTEDKSLLASGIALAGANVAARQHNSDDGLMSAREFCDQDLSDVDLIVLSACQTALGEVSDEGPAGLIRGLKKAGAKAIIATLWSVFDYSTSLFMQYFYEEYCLNGTDKHRALKVAQDRLKSYEGKRYEEYFDPEHKVNVTDQEKFSIEHPFEKPYFWAPFILIDI